jgi:hypothetical protein
MFFPYLLGLLLYIRESEAGLLQSQQNGSVG